MGDIGTPRDDLELLDVVLFNLQGQQGAIADDGGDGEDDEVLMGRCPEDRGFFSDDNSDDGFFGGQRISRPLWDRASPRAGLIVPRLQLPLKRGLTPAIGNEGRSASTASASPLSARLAPQLSSSSSWYIGTPRDDATEPSKRLQWSAAAFAAELRRAVGSNRPAAVASALELAAASSSDPKDADALLAACLGGGEAPDGGAPLLRDAVAAALAELREAATAARRPPPGRRRGGGGAEVAAGWTEAMQRRLAICFLLAQCGAEAPVSPQPVAGPVLTASPFFPEAEPDAVADDKGSLASGEGSPMSALGLGEVSESGRHRALPEELRFADDGFLYTRAEFCEEWGEVDGERHWSGAIKACERRHDRETGPGSYADFLGRFGVDVARLRWSLAHPVVHGEVSALMTVIGGARAGGVVVREGCALQSRELGERLARRAEVEAIEYRGSRMRYRLVRGSGPATGWITWSMGDRRLVRRSRQTEITLAHE